MVVLLWFVTVSPWVIRNTLAFHRAVPIRNNFGLELWLGNLPSSDGSVRSDQWAHPMDSEAERAKVIAMGEDAYMRQKSFEAIQQIRGAPTRFAYLTFRRILLYWLGEPTRATSIFGLQVPTGDGMS